MRFILIAIALSLSAPAAAVDGVFLQQMGNLKNSVEAQ